jgi:nucleotide-binding universal stress UspA family protein
LATDFSKPARRAYVYALQLAARLERRLVLLHVVKAPPGVEAWSLGARRSIGSMKTKALLELGRMVRLGKDQDVSTDHRLVVGIPQDAIVKVAGEARADFIVMGTHGRTGWNRLRLGSIAQEVLRKASCPVLTVREALDAHVNRRRPTWNRFLVAVDFSPSSKAAVRVGVMLATQLDANIRLMHAIQESGDSGLMQADDRACHEADRRLRSLAAAVQSNRVVSESLVAQGSPAEVILDQAKRMKADLIVVGTNGRRGVKRLVLGSVAESVVRSAGCPVLVVKA